MKTAIVNLGKIITGDWRDPFADGDTVIMEEGKFTRVGTASADEADRLPLTTALRWA